MPTTCFSGRFDMFSASGTSRRVFGDTEVISIVESSSIEVGWSKVGVDEDVGSGINSV